MKKIIVKRFKETQDCTVSKIYFKDENDTALLDGFLYGLEPLKEGLQRDDNLRVPAGKYGVIWHPSYRFGMQLPLLHNMEVPKDRDILFHSGNTAKDTIGCILLGSDISYAKEYTFLKQSRLALEKMLVCLKQNSQRSDLSEWIVEIKNDFEPKENE